MLKGIKTTRDKVLDLRRKSLANVHTLVIRHYIGPAIRHSVGRTLLSEGTEVLCTKKHTKPLSLFL
jgi:hypothetical protein